MFIEMVHKQIRKTIRLIEKCIRWYYARFGRFISNQEIEEGQKRFEVEYQAFKKKEEEDERSYQEHLAQLKEEEEERDRQWERTKERQREAAREAEEQYLAEIREHDRTHCQYCDSPLFKGRCYDCDK